MNKIIGRLYVSTHAWIIKQQSKLRYDDPRDIDSNLVRTWFLIPTIHIRKIYYPMRYTETAYYTVQLFFLCYGYDIAVTYIENLRDLVLMRRWVGKKECTKKVEV